MAAPIPFIHEITVRWSDCDPAQIVYTGRIPNFALEAIDAWWEAVTGEDWYRMNVDRDIGAPFVHLSLDFRKTLTPRHKLVCEVILLRVGDSSVRFRVHGYQDGQLCFEGEFVEVFVRADAHVKMAAPEEIRETLLNRLSAEKSAAASDMGGKRKPTALAE
ncbi:MAG: acyl-CoA thioesterase [Rhizobiaceae bacterium]